MVAGEAAIRGAGQNSFTGPNRLTPPASSQGTDTIRVLIHAKASA